MKNIANYSLIKSRNGIGWPKDRATRCTQSGAKPMRRMNQLVLSLMTLCALSACGPNEQQKVELTEKRRLNCLDHFCDGDVSPPRQPGEEALKLNGQWYIGPKEYFSNGMNGAAFWWWDHKPLSRHMEFPPELKALQSAGKDEFGIDIFLRSTHIPSQPNGYKLIALAQANDWIASRTTLRPGLDVVKMKHVIGPNGYHIDHVTYYVATQLKSTDGFAPVATCQHDSQYGMGGTGFLWQQDVWAGTRMNQQHCADFPEIFQEISRVLTLIKKA
jgi:hypothetical protein